MISACQNLTASTTKGRPTEKYKGGGGYKVQNNIQAREN